MLKYNDVITKLSDEQKIRILSGVGRISGKDMKNLGIPCVTLGNMKSFGRDLYPHTTSISHAWNTKLWGEVAEAKVDRMISDGVGFFVAHGAKIKLSPYRKETTEDPYLATAISASYMKAAADRGLVTGASGYYIAESDVDWLDEKPDVRVLNEYVVAPYKRSGKIAASQAVVTDLRRLHGEYGDTCAYLQRSIENDAEFLVCEHAADDNTVDLVARGIICLEGSANALRSALVRHRKLQKLLNEGKDVTVEQIESELACRKAISDETVDAALDKALDFIFRCAERVETDEREPIDEDALALRATLESTVLLKNDGGLLPLKSGKRIAIVDCITKDLVVRNNLGERVEAALIERGFTVSRTYGVDVTGCTEDGVKNIAGLCRTADATLLLLGSDYESERLVYKNEKLTLPPEQLYLANKIGESAKNVSAVVFSEHATDMEFARPFDALLLTPREIKHSAEAIVRVVTGESEAMGRLAYTLYSGSETSLKKGYAYRRSYGMRSGAFIGYGYYDTADMRVGYPFGHGLSYTEFEYTDISVTENEVSFTVRNIGARAGCEVSQIYAGLDGSSVIRPKKRLVGFAKIELEPLERARVSVKFELPRVYCEGELVLEKGEYTVYVGSSVSDVRLTGKVCAGDASLTPDGEKLSDYLQTSTNVLNDKYTLEADYGFMKKGFKNILVGVGAIGLAIALAVFNMTTHLNSITLGVISGILALVAVLFFIIDAVEKSRARARYLAEVKEANETLFEEAEQIPVLSTERMFEDNFDAPREEHEQSKNEELFSITADFGTTDSNVNDDFRMANAVAEFNKFASERGYKMGNGVTESLFASLTTSRLLVLLGLNAEQFNSFILLLSEYFNSRVCIDNSAKSAVAQNPQSAFFGYDYEGYKVRKNIFTALTSAANAPATVQISAIDEISSDNVNAWIAPLMRYLRAPKKRNDIAISDDDGRISLYNIARNLWIAIRLSDGQTVDMLPAETLRCASVVNISFSACQPAEEHMATHGFSAQQADYMVEKESAKADVPEDIWKKIDRLERYAKDHSGYAIGNKLWLELEKHIGMLLACEMDVNEAVDAGISSRILPSVTAELKDKLGKEDKTVYQTVEFIFGADNVVFSKAYTDSLKVNS